MTMTRRDFEHVADALLWAGVTDRAATRIADYLQTKYPNFDADRFTARALAEGDNQ